ncbi:MAG: cell division protein FtsA [Bacteroidales bacterium]|nr:cell division protein FtsA [Bacteroidales bacterium]MDD4215772.1 cell division protein FtsA [Bacteroidales bacterium]MDY0140379.1 cell division protein FtsA [Bacteroidales bacterium]
MENKSEIIAAIDIGTTKIVAIAGRKTETNRFEVVGFATTASKGIRRGVVLNIDETVNSIRISLNKILKDSGLRLNDVFVGIAGQHVKTSRNRCSINIKDEDSIIKVEHVEALRELMKQSVEDPGEKLLDIIPQSYIVDNETGIENPVAMNAKVLQGNFHIVMGQMSMVNNIKKCVTIAGLKVNSLILEPIASAEAVLTPHEKKSGVAMIDIGGGTTDLAVFINNHIIHTAVIPIGGYTITNDIKNQLSILEKQAEELKIQYGSAIAEKNQENTIISLEGLKGREEKEFSLYELNDIIQARMEEILHAAMFQIETSGIKDKLAGGIVITGGGALLTNLKQLASYLTGNDIRIAYPTEYIEGAYSDIINKPQFSTAIGLIMKGDAYNKLEIEKSIYQKINDEKKELEESSSDKKKKKKEGRQNNGGKDSFKSILARFFDEDEN